jgi:hypothetical protein
MTTVALTNKDYKQNWINSYYPYGKYMIVNNKMILGGDEIKVNNEILTEQVIKNSTSGFDSKPSTVQAGGKNKNIKNYKIKADSVESAFQKLEKKVLKGGKGDILVLQLESLDDKNKINFYKIYRKKI